MTEQSQIWFNSIMALSARCNHMHRVKATLFETPSKSAPVLAACLDWAAGTCFLFDDYHAHMKSDGWQP